MFYCSARFKKVSNNIGESEGKLNEFHLIGLRFGAGEVSGWGAGIAVRSGDLIINQISIKLSF
jgi:hypothetical protein